MMTKYTFNQAKIHGETGAGIFFHHDLHAPLRLLAGNHSGHFAGSKGAAC